MLSLVAKRTPQSLYFLCVFLKARARKGWNEHTMREQLSEPVLFYSQQKHNWRERTPERARAAGSQLLPAESSSARLRRGPTFAFGMKFPRKTDGHIISPSRRSPSARAGMKIFLSITHATLFSTFANMPYYMFNNEASRYQMWKNWHKQYNNKPTGRRVF